MNGKNRWSIFDSHAVYTATQKYRQGTQVTCELHFKLIGKLVDFLFVIKLIIELSLSFTATCICM